MIHRIALLAGGFIAAAVLAFSVMRGDRSAVDAAAADPTAQATADHAVRGGTREVVDTVYVAAPKRPKVVHVTRRVPARRPSTVSTTRHTRRSQADEREHESGEHESGEHERGDD